MPTIIEIQSPLKIALTLNHFTGVEKISSPFQFEVEMRSDKAISATPQEIIGKNMTITLELPENKKRYFSGIISAFSFGKFNEAFTYHVTLIPSLALLRFRKNSRIFQQKTVKQILEQILSEHRISAQYKINGTLPKIEYCVQYQETDFDFISRLLEQAGIFYCFKHEKNNHKLIFSDNTQIYEESITQAGHLSSQGSYAQLKTWEVNYAFFTGAIAHNAHDFTAPDKKLLSKKTTQKSVGNNPQYEMYIYPGSHNTTQKGETLNTLSLEQHETQAILGHGESTYSTLGPCSTITLDNKQFPSDKNKKYAVIEIHHQLNMNYEDQMVYHNTFKSIPATTIFRSHLGLQKPHAPSTQLAVIVGPKGKELYTDKYCRLKVHFYWDRDSKKNESSSCWIRTAHHWEGVLRIGTPVIVGFIDDDIDHPIILGPLHDANMMPLYALDGEQTKSAIKRRCPKKDIEKTYNEIRFEDKKDKQELYVYASKDLVITVENDSTQTVKKGNYLLKVKGDVTIQADGAMTFDAKKDMTLSAQNITLKAKSKLTQDAANIEHTAKAKIETKASMQNINADGVLTLKGGLIKEN